MSRRPLDPRAALDHAAEMAETAASPSRRSLLSGVATLVGAAVAGTAAIVSTTEPTAAVEADPAAFEVGDGPTVTSNDGRVASLYLSPAIAVSWADFGDGVDEVEITLAVGGEAGVDVVYAETLQASDPDATPGDVSSIEAAEGTDEAAESAPDFDAVDGSITVELDRADVTERGDAVTSDALSDDALDGGGSTTTELDIVLRAEVRGGADEASVVRTSTLEVGVENPAGDADAGGNVEVSAS